MNLEKLCLDIARTEDADDVIKILKVNSLWENPENWKIIGFGENINNHSIIGNQQTHPANALVEKLVNCGDSALVLRCYEEGIDPFGDDAPKNVKDAIEKFFGVRDGKWLNITAPERTKLAEKYCNLIATGESGRGSNPTMTILDNCEGQHPSDFTKTFLSLVQGNKVKLGFTQGKFGMGSFGAVNFCTKFGLQLIISKKNPCLVPTGQKNEWGFTLVRKIPPTNKEKSSKWQYFVVDDQIPSFSKEDLKLYPGEYPNPYGGSFPFGSFIKLYNYELGSLRTNIVFDLNFRINSLLVNPVVPIRFYERRDGFKGKSLQATLDGLETKIQRDRSKVLEEGFPSNFSFNVKNQTFIGNIYAFKKYSDIEQKIKRDDAGQKYANGVIFTLNGQANASYHRGFFGQGKLHYENISKNLLVTIDCSKVDNLYLEHIFQSDRERISQREIVKEIRLAIADILEKHPGIRKFQNSWKSSQIKEIQNNQNTKDLFEKLIAKNKNLTSYFLKGDKLENPFSKKEGELEKYDGEYWPTFFETKKSHPKEFPRVAEKGRSYRINLITNAQNDYFYRSQDQGSFKIFRFDEDITNIDGVQLSGFDGRWVLTLPEFDNELQHYRFEVTDVKKYKPLVCEFFLKLEEKKDRPHSNSKNKKKTSVQFNFPKIKLLERENFSEFDIDEKDILFVNRTMDEHEFYLNMANNHINNYLKTLTGTELDYAKEQYKLSASLLGLVLIDQHKKEFPDDVIKDNTISINEYSKKYTKTLAPIHMPFIRDISAIIDNS